MIVMKAPLNHNEAKIRKIISDIYTKLSWLFHRDPRWTSAKSKKNIDFNTI